MILKVLKILSLNFLYKDYLSDVFISNFLKNIILFLFLNQIFINFYLEYFNYALNHCYAFISAWSLSESINH